MNKNKSLKLTLIYFLSGFIFVFMSPVIVGFISLPFLFLIKNLEQALWLTIVMFGVLIILGVILIAKGIKSLNRYLSNA